MIIGFLCLFTVGALLALTVTLSGDKELSPERAARLFDESRAGRAE